MASLAAFSLSLIVVFFISCSSAERSRKELRDGDVKDNSIVQYGNPAWYNRVNPSQVTQLSWRPRVFLYKGLLSDEECDHLISLVQAHRLKENYSRNNDDDLRNIDAKRQLLNLEFSLNTEDEIVARVEEKISTWTLLPKENSKPLQISSYRDEKTKKAYYYFNNHSTSNVREPLMATVLLYLSDVTRGGNILFPKSEALKSDCTTSINELRPSKGDAILFFSLLLDTSPDSSSSHARCPVLEGELWCGVKNFFIRSIGMENISVDSDDSECTDQDGNCPQWAALGECDKNPVFMIGSPDYYGTCRKSCNAC